MSAFKIGEKVRVTNINGQTEGWSPETYTTVGLVGTVVEINTGSLPIRVEFEEGLAAYKIRYKESELELADDELDNYIEALKTIIDDDDDAFDTEELTRALLKLAKIVRDNR
jgi:hypothetical protein